MLNCVVIRICLQLSIVYVIISFIGNVLSILKLCEKMLFYYLN